MALSSYESLADSSRIWIYRADRLLSSEESQKINNWLVQFINKWTAHNQTLNSYGQVYHDRFVVIFLDEESSTEASGCSIDSQVRFIREVGNTLKIDFFDRLHFDFWVDEKLQSFHKDEVKSQIEAGTLMEDSLVFDHLIKSKDQFEKSWSVPLSQSWHQRLI